MSQGGAATVLVVDDDPSLRMLCRVNLELDGYRVIEAATLSAAREALGGGGVDVVLLDVHVGAEDARSLLRALRAEGPKPAVALFTGSTTIDPADVDLADAVLRKPFALEELQATVRRLAAGR